MDTISELRLSIQRQFNKKVLTISEVSTYLGINEDAVKELVDVGSLACLSTTSYLFSSQAIACFELGVHDNFTSPSNKQLATIADTALYSVQDFDEEEFNMAVAHYGEGSVYWYEKRKCYQAAFYLVQPNGDKVRKIVSGATEYEVIAKMGMVKAQDSLLATQGTVPIVVVNAGAATPIKASPTFQEVAAQYMDLARNQNSDSTYFGKVGYVNNNLLPHFSEMPIASININIVQQFVKTLEIGKNNKRMSKAHIKNIVTTMKAIFNYAYRMGYIERTPCNGLVVPKGIAPNKDSKVLTEGELVDVIRATMESPMYLTFTILALSTGMRSEELLAIQWQDIDFDNKTVDINKAMIQVLNKNPKGKKWIKTLGPTKTEASKRKIPLSDVACSQLIEWRQHLQDSGIMAKAMRLGNEEFVFIGQKGEPRDYDNLLDNYKKFLARRGETFGKLNVTFHKFRHSYATHLRSLKVDPMVIKVYMGHSLEEDITEGTYTSVTAEMRKEAMDILNKFIESLWSQAIAKGAISDPNGRNGKAIRE